MDGVWRVAVAVRDVLVFGRDGRETATGWAMAGRMRWHHRGEGSVRTDGPGDGREEGV